MTDRPIIFSAAMVRALLDGRKTQTRRLATSPLRKCEVGDRLWVRETFRLDSAYDDIKPTKAPENAAVWFCVDGSKVGDGVPGKTRVSIHMPRWASRLTLIVEAVRVEPLQAISEADAIAEGVYGHETDLGRLYSFERPGDPAGRKSTIAQPAGFEKASHAYCRLWESLHGAESWDANPQVVAISFLVTPGNIDRIERL